MMQPTTHRIALPNATGEGSHEIAFYDWGNPDAARTVVCVHGLTRNARDFDWLAAALAARGRRVLCLSMPGRGESDWLADPMGYTYPAYVADCLAVMDNFHLRQVEWVGTSMGGIVGMMVAASTDRIRRLVLNDIGIHLSAESLKRIYGYVAGMPKQFADRAALSTYLAEAFKPFGITEPALWERFVSSSAREKDGTLRYACDPAILEPLRSATRDFTEVNDINLAAVWEEVSAPTLVLHGAESDILSVETIRGMRALNPKTESITFPGVGHAPPLMTEAQIRPVVDWLTGDAMGMLASGL